MTTRKIYADLHALAHQATITESDIRKAFGIMPESAPKALLRALSEVTRNIDIAIRLAVEIAVEEGHAEIVWH